MADIIGGIMGLFLGMAVVCSFHWRLPEARMIVVVSLLLAGVLLLVTSMLQL